MAQGVKKGPGKEEMEKMAADIADSRENGAFVAQLDDPQYPKLLARGEDALDAATALMARLMLNRVEDQNTRAGTVGSLFLAVTQMQNEGIRVLIGNVLTDGRDHRAWLVKQSPKRGVYLTEV